MQGNVTFRHGPGTFTTNFDGYQTQLPVLVRGNLSVLGTGANTLTVGTEYNHTGLVVGKKFTLTSAGGAAESVTFNKLRVGGNTSLTLGDGGNTLTIDDSEFGGTFTMASGAGADTINLEPTGGTNSATEFLKAVKMDSGAGSDAVYLGSGASAPDAGQLLVFWSTVVFLSDHLVFVDAPALLPNGGAVTFSG